MYVQIIEMFKLLLNIFPNTRYENAKSISLYQGNLGRCLSIIFPQMKPLKNVLLKFTMKSKSSLILFSDFNKFIFDKQMITTTSSFH